MSRSDDFPYTKQQQAWWFATHGDDKSSSRVTPSVPEALQQGVRSLAARKEAQVRSGQMAPSASFTYGWAPMETRGKDWHVRDQSGKLVKKFSDPNEAAKFAAGLTTKANKK